MGRERIILARFTRHDLRGHLVFCSLGALWFALMTWAIVAAFQNPWNLLFLIPVVYPGWVLLGYGFLGGKALLHILLKDDVALWLEGDTLLGIFMLDASTKSIPIADLSVVSITKVRGKEASFGVTAFGPPYRSIDLDGSMIDADVGVLAKRIAAMTELELDAERKAGPRKYHLSVVQWMTPERKAIIAENERKRIAANERRRARRLAKAQAIEESQAISG
jgi:hypothetical protein